MHDLAIAQAQYDATTDEPLPLSYRHPDDDVPF